MAVQGNLDGTRRDEFTLGKEETNGIRRTLSGETALYDPVSGQATIAEMLGSGGTSILESRGILTTQGGLVYTPTVGGIAFVVRAP
jgi:hypothetical protein